MYAFIMVCLITLVGVGGIIRAFTMRPGSGSDNLARYRSTWGVGGAAAILLAFLILFFAGFNTVPNKSLGLPVSFGKVGSALTPGFHWEWPWISVAEISKTVHTIQFGQSVVTVSSAPGNISGPSISTRIGGQQTAQVDITIAYSVTDAGAPVLYQDYNGQGSDIMDTIAKNLIVREEERVVNNVLGDYNPLLDVSISRGASSSQFTSFGPEVQRQLQADLGNLVDIRSVLILPPHYSSLTEQNLQRVQYQYGQTIIAAEQILTNQKQAQANAAIASSLVHDPGVLQFQCLTIAEQAIKEGDTTVQPGWCFGSSGVIANTGK